MKRKKKEVRGQHCIEKNNIFRIWKKKIKKGERDSWYTPRPRTFAWEREKEEKEKEEVFFENRTIINLNIFPELFNFFGC